MLEIKELYASVDSHEVLKGLNLNIKPGQVHAIMGPNGSGKSTTAHVLAGKPGYTVTSGSVLYKGQNLLEMEPDARARAGLFLAFQYPVEIPGVNNAYFIKSAMNARRAEKGEDEIDAVDFLTLAREKLKLIEASDKYLKRAVNQGFSGGEKKRNEVLQMLLLEPELAILDETDSGLDIDAMRVIAEGVNSLRDGKRSFLVITHYQRLLDYIQPDVVHVLADGKIVRSGDKSLAHQLEKEGYSWIENPAQA